MFEKTHFWSLFDTRFSGLNKSGTVSAVVDAASKVERAGRRKKELTEKDKVEKEQSQGYQL